MVQRKEIIVAAPAASIAFLSIFCSIYIVWHAYKVRSTLLAEIEKPNECNGGDEDAEEKNRLQEGKCRHIVLADHIIWLSISDLTLEVWAILSWGTLALGTTYVSSNYTFCISIANLNAMSAIGSSVWQFFISWTVLTLVRKKLCGRKYFIQVTPENVKSILRRRILIWIVCVIFILGLFWGKHVFGVQYNLPHHRDPECWVTSKKYAIVELAPIFFDVLFSLFVLGNVLYAYWKQQYNNGSEGIYIPPKKKKKIDSKSTFLLEKSVHENNPLPKDGKEKDEDEDEYEIKATFVLRTSQLVMIFVCIWGVILGIRAYEMVTQKQVPLWVIVIHHSFIASIPIGNFIVWSQWSTFQNVNLQTVVSTRA